MNTWPFPPYPPVPWTAKQERDYQAQQQSKIPDAPL